MFNFIVKQIAQYISANCDKLTTEWSPWLQTNWRDSGYTRGVALVWETNCIRQPKRQLPSSSYNHNTH